MKRPAVFMDRDGTVNEQMGYINHISRFVILPNVAEAVRLLNENGFLAIIISNQSGVARDYFPIDLIYEIHDELKRSMKEKGAAFDGIYFCPHYPQGRVAEYSFACNCRKPNTGLIEQALKDFDVDMSRSYVVGDHYTDLELAERCGLDGILVKTGYGLGDMTYVLPKKKVKAAYIAGDLLDAVKWILKKERPAPEDDPA